MPGSYQGVALFVSSARRPRTSALEVVRRVAEGAARRRAARRARRARCWRCSIAVGIGLHNFGEGLAIGAAFALGEAALGTLLVIGFTLHNTTEGLAIVAPIAKERPSICDVAAARPDRRRADDRRRVGRRLRLFAGARPSLFLGLGAGAIAQVALQIARQVAGGHPLSERFATAPVMVGLLAGFGVMYATGLLVG